jgi:hypothetical protein
MLDKVMLYFQRASMGSTIHIYVIRTANVKFNSVQILNFSSYLFLFLIRRKNNIELCQMLNAFCTLLLVIIIIM